jgi:hypothetical protein
MLRALASGVEGAPPLYHTMARVWGFVFGGPTELSLRLFSAAGFCTALVLVWMVLRRQHTFRATGFGLLTVWTTSSLVLYQNSEARNYGLFMSAVALVVCAYLLAAEREHIPLWLLACTTAVHAITLMSHLFGIIYSGATLGSVIAWDLLNLRWRASVYVAILSSWLVLLPWVPAIFHELALTKPHGYIPRPGLDSLEMLLLETWARWPILVLAIVVALASILAGDSLETDRPAEIDARRKQTLLLAIAFLAVPLFIVGLSRLWTPIFVERYMIPSLIGLGLLLVEVAERLMVKSNLSVRSRILADFAWILLFAMFIIRPIRQALRHDSKPRPNAFIEQRVPAGLPVAVENLHDFLPLTYYTQRPDRPYYFILDRETAYDEHNDRSQAFVYNERIVWKKNGYLADRTVTTGEFLCSFDRFAVLHDPQLLWYQARIAGNPAFDSENLGQVGNSSIWLVKRRANSAWLPACPER